ncbi:MAG: TetR/AcrR family transcriptional regulator [Pseudomonadota bacterium]
MSATARKRDPKATRQRILTAAGRLLAQGEGALEMAWVAREAGVSQGLAYHHFGSKDGLIQAVVSDFYDRIEEAVLMARLEEIDDWELRERQRVHQYIEFLLDDPLGVTVITRLAHTPAVAAVEAERWYALVSVGARNIAEGQASGAVGATEHSELLAAMVLGSIRAAVARAVLEDSARNVQQLAQDIWAYARRGLCLEVTNE